MVSETNFSEVVRPVLGLATADFSTISPLNWWRSLCEVQARNPCYLSPAQCTVLMALHNSLTPVDGQTIAKFVACNTIYNPHAFRAYTVASLWSHDPLSCSTFTPELFRMYPPADVIKDYVTVDDMEDLIECYTGQALVKEELSKAELEAQGMKTWQEFVVQHAYTSYFEI